MTRLARDDSPAPPSGQPLTLGPYRLDPEYDHEERLRYRVTLVRRYTVPPFTYELFEGTVTQGEQGDSWDAWAYAGGARKSGRGLSAACRWLTRQMVERARAGNL